MKKESTHAIAINAWINSESQHDIFKYFSSSKTNYYCGFREADFLDFYFFSYSNISFIASVCDKKTKNQVSFLLLLSQLVKTASSFSNLWQQQKQRTLDFGLSIWFIVNSHRLRNKNFVKTQQCKWRWSKQLDTYGRHWTEVNSAKSEIIIKVIYPKYSKH